MPFDDGEDRSVLGLPAAAPRAAWCYGYGPDQLADVYLPASDSGITVALIHGGFWRPEYDRVHVRPMAAALAEAGHPVVSLEYSRIPGDPDRTLADLVLAIEHLLADPPSGVPRRPPVVVGHSAGGHLALLLAIAQPRRIHAALALAPVADLLLADDLALDGDAVRAFLGEGPRARPDLNPASGLHPSSPVTILHGDRDSLVPVSLSESYRSAAGSVVDLRVLPGFGHFPLVDPRSDAFPQVLAAIGRTGIE